MYVNFFKLTTKIYDKKMYHFEKSVIMDCPIEKAFTFHTDTNNLKLISPSSVKTEIIKIELPLVLNSEVELSVTQFGIFKSYWKVKISQYIENEVIGDYMVKGPFKYWYHRHCFDRQAGKTIMTDRVDYDLPFGFLGDIAHTLFAKKMIESMFEFRHKKTKEILEKI